ncbi:MAG: nitrate reductase subunit beta [Cyanobacteria bacterium HKST-UBA03]|nr:nitrate reductase subunit beta [Cyanobacteria bacterium HKST-UBA03]
MDVRMQIAMVFHLDKCIGCHTCSIACKNIWTDRKGSEYMWWNNVETKPGTGYPTQWEDQEKYQGGWERTEDGSIRLKSQTKSSLIRNIFHNPRQPVMDDYYEPFAYDYEELFNAPLGDDQPTARPVSQITGEFMDKIESGPNWDDDLAGSPIYAENDPNLNNLSHEQRAQLLAVENLVMMYFPRICNHCLNPSCVASCPSGALYKRGEDGIVLVDQEICRGWRSCVSACPYKKVYYNWSTGKSEKCILCYPRLETGQAPACFHSCVGRIRYLGPLLYDADQIEAAASVEDKDLIDAHRNIVLDPYDPQVIENALAGGMPRDVIEAAQKSPVYKFVKVWKIALPPHIEYRTMPMLFYVPPLSPVQSSVNSAGDALTTVSDNLFHDIESSRLPLQFLSSLFGAGQDSYVLYALKKQKAVRMYRRLVTVGDVDEAQVQQMLKEADMTPEEADAIYNLTALCTFDERFVVPPMNREQAVEMMREPWEQKGAAGYNFVGLGGAL